MLKFDVIVCVCVCSDMSNICQITLEAMKSEIDEVALQGIEFWSNVCDEEVDLAIEASEAAELGRPPERTSRFYAKGALQVRKCVMNFALVFLSSYSELFPFPVLCLTDSRFDQ